jgi:acyl-coenzyme A synthetase/AMP-(fatty) acid ligase
VVVAGEALAQGLVKRHQAELPDVALFNEYGPTEGTVWSTVHRCDAEDEGPYAPIGRAVDGVEVTLVDEQLEPVPPGVEGEIVVSGRQLARCYLGQPRQTADRFVPHPDDGGARRYRTGDRGRLNAGGDMVYLGRMDAMVKVRGFRVELSEVEGWLRMQPEVSDAVVVPEQVAGTARLVAVLVPVAGESGLAPLLPGRLAQHLPAYCIPTVWREVGRLPLTPHGKTDRAAAAALHATKRPTTPTAREANHD